MATPIRVRFRWRRSTLLRLLALAALTLLLTALIARTGLRVGASTDPDAAVAPARQFYITDLALFADEAPTACAAGYHFASLWEIADPSNLKYNASLGQTTLDSGEGPPTTLGLGWVRTGYNFSDSSTTPGHANCLLWSSRANTDSGSVAVLPNNWSTGAQDLGVWDVSTRTCNFKLGAWCVQDAFQFQYLPSLLIP